MCAQVSDPAFARGLRNLNRSTRLLGTADNSWQVLEIGAGYCPIAPKSQGWNTHVVDHASRDELRAKYAAAQVDIDVIEEVDTIWHEGGLHEAVPAKLAGHVDMIIASHVLEHIPDPIGFFASASILSSPHGVLSIALPDRRYCFDCFKPWTTTGELLDAHRRKATRHSLKTAFDHMAYSAVVDGALAWGAHPISKPVLLDSFDAAAATAASFQERRDRPYQDYHAWQFTPAGFELMVLELTRLGLMDWHLEKLDGPVQFEFFALLRRGGDAGADAASLQTRRRDLLIRQLVETRDQIDFILGTPDGVAPAPEREASDYRSLAAKLAEQEVRLRETAEALASIRSHLKPRDIS